MKRIAYLVCGILLSAVVGAGAVLAANPAAGGAPAAPAPQRLIGLHGGKIIAIKPPGDWAQGGGPAGGSALFGLQLPFSVPVFGTDVNIAASNETFMASDPANPLYFLTGSNAVARSVSTNGGVTWSTTSPAGIGDPVGVWDDAGNAYFGQLSTGSCPDPAVVSRSSNGGASWGSQVTALSDASPGDHFIDKPWMAADNNPSSPYHGRLYVTGTSYYAPGCNLGAYVNDREVIAYSTNQGASWSTPVTLSDASHDQNQFTNPVVANNGTLYVSYQYQNCTYDCTSSIPMIQLITKSTDGGVTFSPSITITGQPISPTGAFNGGYQYLYANSTSVGFRHNDQVILGVSPSNPNHVYAAWTDGRYESSFVYASVTGQHSDIVFTRSTDGGATWAPIVKVNDDVGQGKDQFFPWMTVGSDGTIHLSWMDRREAAVNGFPYREYYSQSTDEGVTWSANQPVGDVANTPSSFIGDYSGLAVNSDNTRVLPVWTDQRSGQRIYTDPGLIPPGTPTVTPTPGGPTNTPTNTPTLTPTPTQTPCSSSAITNGGFETGSLAPWTVLGTNPSPVTSNALAHSGTYSALLGTLSGPEPLGDGSMYQTITVPASGGTLSFWWNGQTTDSLTYDWQDAYITDTSGTILTDIMHDCETTNGWINQTFNMAPYAGQTVRVEFLVHQDGFGDDTSMYVDDVALLTACATGTPATATNTPVGSPTTLEPTTTFTPFPATSTPVGATNTPGVATNTPGAATNTPVATNTPGGPSPTPCSISFSDVHPSDYFYTPVTYLYCHGVISGYSDGTFRPFAETTRSQMVKIVVLGFQKPISTPSGGNYTFADVQPSNPFFPYVETAAALNIVSGYTCGGPGEPCDPQSRPYFRPFANVTRGQLCKIDVVAAGWPLVDPPTGTFEDVASGSAFYKYIETAYAHHVISGYTCGGVGEPCDPGQRPYFRVGANATRGQIAKIVYLSITGP